MRVLALLVVLALALSGCLNAGTSPLDAGATKDPTPEGLLAHTSGALAPVPDPWRDLAVRILPTGFTGAEPTIGVATDGTLFIAGPLPAVDVNGPYGSELIRSRDNGLTWEWVGDPVTDPKSNNDPWLWLDPLTDRVYNVPLYIVCSWAQWTDDLGETWDANPVAGCPPTQHDHQKVTTGPPAAGVTTSGYPNVVYYAYNSLIGSLVVAKSPVPLPRLGTFVSVSYDGGRTFQPGVNVHPNDPCHVGINGPVAVAPDGTAYLPKGVCDGLSVIVSRDSGKTWEIKGPITGVGSLNDFAFDPTMAVDADGNAYAVWPGEDAQVYLSRTSDRGDTWTAPLRVTPPHVNATVYSAIAAGATGKLAIAYLGTDADVGKWSNPVSSEADDTTVWHLYLTFTENALDPNPTFITQRVTPADDPVQMGCVWMRGGESECRNLYDFIGLALSRDGRAYVSYVDGCAKCASASASRNGDVTVAYVETGPSLLLDALLPDA